MTFLEKQNAIIQKLHDTNYELFDGDKDEALDTLETELTAFPEYANVVIREQIMVPIWRERCEPEEFRENVQNMDTRRRDAHDNAITSVNVLNRISSKLGLEPFADIDTNDRHAVAEMVGQYTNELYNNGIGGSFDDAVYDKKQEYDTKKVSERLQRAVYELNTGHSGDETGYELS